MPSTGQSAQALPACPWCKTAKGVYVYGPREFFCRGCKRLFDGDPAEGGDYSDRDPSARIERQERCEHQRR